MQNIEISLRYYIEDKREWKKRSIVEIYLQEAGVSIMQQIDTGKDTLSVFISNTQLLVSKKLVCSYWKHTGLIKKQKTTDGVTKEMLQINSKANAIQTDI